MDNKCALIWLSRGRSGEGLTYQAVSEEWEAERCGPMFLSRLWMRATEDKRRVCLSDDDDDDVDDDEVVFEKKKKTLRPKLLTANPLLNAVISFSDGNVGGKHETR